MIKELRDLPTLAKWFLQSRLEEIDITHRHEPSVNNRGSLLESQNSIIDDIFQHILNYRERDKIGDLIEYIIVNGDPGIGKSTLARHLVGKVIRERVFVESEVLCVSIYEHSSIDSLYSLCSKIARKLNLRKDSAALEELEGSRERKDAAVLNVLRHFRLVFFDDIDADDCEIWKHVMAITKDVGQSLLVIGTSVNIGKGNQDLQNLKTFKINSIKEDEIKGLFGNMLHIDETFPGVYLKFAQGVPSNVCIISRFLMLKGNTSYFLPYLANKKAHEISSCFPSVLASELDFRSKYQLAQLCKIRRPIPVKDVTCFSTLQSYGLVIVKHQGEQAFLSVPSTIQKIHKSLTSSDHEHSDLRKYSAAELWKDIMSPKLQEILIGCQKENWTFVPESWYCIWFL